VPENSERSRASSARRLARCPFPVAFSPSWKRKSQPVLFLNHVDQGGRLLVVIRVTHLAVNAYRSEHKQIYGERRLMWNQMGHAVSLSVYTLFIFDSIYKNITGIPPPWYGSLSDRLTFLLLTYLPSVTQEKIALRKGRAWSGAPECWPKSLPTLSSSQTYPEGMPHIDGLCMIDSCQSRRLPATLIGIGLHQHSQCPQRLFVNSLLILTIMKMLGFM